MPDTQRYNYVLLDSRESFPGEGEIYTVLVAVWDGNVTLDEVKQLCDRAKDGAGVEPTPAVMINSEVELCTSDINPLDALSKHFMLAQGADTTIEKFDRKKWPFATVAYAGELEVDVADCTFSINSDSGTYRPQSVFRVRVLAILDAVLGSEVGVLAPGDCK